jgi:hypothetical protein
VILLPVSALIVVAIVVALRMRPPAGNQNSYLAISAAPLLLTTGVPLLFVLPSVLTRHESADWARTVVNGVSLAGIALSFLFFAIRTVLTVRAARAGGGRMASVLAMQTALASLPAILFSLYAIVMLV